MSAAPAKRHAGAELPAPVVAGESVPQAGGDLHVGKCLFVSAIGVVALLLLITVRLMAVAAQGVGRVPTGRIVFTTNEDNNPGDIYVVNADGTNRVRLTSDPAYDGHPSWSPDGEEIALWSTRDENAGDIYTMQENGQAVMRLTRNAAQDAFPAWSPGGQRIAFASNRDNNRGDIYVMNTDGTEPMRLTYAPELETHPCWSTDGSQVAFVRWRDDGSSRIYVVPAEGGEPQQLVSAGDWVSDPDWCPARDEIAFVVGRGNSNWGDMWFVEALQGSISRRWSYRGREWEPAWSPDGTMVCCSHSRRRSGEHANLMIFDLDSGDTWVVNDSEAADREPDWWAPSP
jgi:Tol biopolymer transport system component